MRTVDPAIWSKSVKNPSIKVSRPNKFGQETRTGLETKLRNSLKDALEEFFSHCSATGVKYINFETENKRQRNIQIILQVLMTLIGVAVVVGTLFTYYHQAPHTITRLYTNISVKDFSFPAVALCSTNIISQMALSNLTKRLYSHPVNKKYDYDESQIKSNLKQMGALLTLTRPRVSETFEKFLTDVEVDTNYNVSRIMLELAPSCSTLLVRCSWRGELMSCKEMFAPRITPLGYCCVFNSRYYEADASNPPRVLDMLGAPYGLGVVFTENPDDTDYRRRPSIGSEMLIFEGRDYPVLEGGEVQLLPIQLNSSTYISLRTSMQVAEPNIDYYTSQVCRSSSAGGRMSCLAQCRRDAAVRLCGCEPYTLQVTQPPARPTCTLSATVCLHKHREKFLYVYPYNSPHDLALVEEQHVSMDCICESECRRRTFTPRASTVQTGRPGHYYKNFLTKGLSLANMSVIRLYYNTDLQSRYLLEISTKWNDILVRISCQWLIICGIPALTLSELVYHCTIRWVHHFRKQAISKTGTLPPELTQENDIL